MNTTVSALSNNNPVGLEGVDFIEFASPDPASLDRLFRAFGFSLTHRHRDREIDLYEQGDIRFMLSRSGDHATAFRRAHGASIVSMGWRVRDAERALSATVERGARRAAVTDFIREERPLPAVYGVGDSLLYLVDGHRDPGRWGRLGFVPLEKPEPLRSKGFTCIDHLTHNVDAGTLGRWASFYKEVFAFTEVRYFDIRGVRTGLTSYALRAPGGEFCIPLNEATEKESQINEYLREHKGPGVQHLAFQTDDILATLAALEGSGIETLDMDDEYYESVFQRVPGVTEDRAEIQRRKVLVDGDEKGYLLQIFTRNVVGPLFIEIIQRKNYASFGEGNFGALFRSIERDQARRGVFGQTEAAR